MRRLAVLVGGDSRDISLGQNACSLDGREHAIDVASLGCGRYSVIVEGMQYAVDVTARDGEPWGATVHGSVLSVEILDPRRLSDRTSGAAASGAQEVRAPMPGRVLAVPVAVGDTVQQGQALVVVEAMKMQNELRSPRNGKIVSLRVAPGDAVSSGDTLVAVG